MAPSAEIVSSVKIVNGNGEHRQNQRSKTNVSCRQGRKDKIEYDSVSMNGTRIFPFSTHRAYAIRSGELHIPAPGEIESFVVAQIDE